ncbi:PRKC apoptosis WT1 regulator protein [Trichosurus vulpecula]|uniref:PRKC apoptosis WT1 regulator protein n=1 Tax=Trichosurus vulpecula TaxID=9337 RepID=UPI00186AFC9D|nr:PRKC apoptosis WT1 regulator protein [Trichosurus vulpecula]XP_036617152.1 PRKC apoptosis WT1 regulator protein [Trichosurus vulpecula]
MATGGYRTGGGTGGTGSTTTDFLEEWKAKREKMRAKQSPQGLTTVPASAVAGGVAATTAAGLGSDGVGKLLAGALGVTPSSTSPAPPVKELHSKRPPGAPAPAAPAPGGMNHPLSVAGMALARAPSEPRRAEDELPSTSAAPPSLSHGPVAGGRAVLESGVQPPLGEREEQDSAKEKGKSSGPSARKGKGQIEKRKLREKRRSTGVVNIPAAECLDEYEDDEAGQKERKREDAITQKNTIQNEAATSDPGGSSLLQETSRTVSSRYKSTNITPEDDVSSRYSRTDRVGSRYNRDPAAPPHLVTLEKKIEDLEKEVIDEREENLRLQKLIQDKEEIIGKLKEEIDLLNRDLDDTEDENEQLKQENKTLLKVVGQLTR